MAVTQTTVLRGVTVVDTRDGSLTPNLDVAVDGDRIRAIKPAGSADGNRIVEAAGKYLVPGYLDMHTHILGAGKHAVSAAELMLAYGITGFREMNSSPELLAQRRDGVVPIPPDGPRLLALAGPVLTPFNASTAEAAIRQVNRQRDQGADFIKFAVAPPASFKAAQTEARRVGLPYAGHLPGVIDVLSATGGGMMSIEHLGPGSGVIGACSTDPEAIRAKLASAPRRSPPPLPPFKIPFLDALIKRRIRRVLTNPMLQYAQVEIDALRMAIDTFDEDRAIKVSAQIAADATWQCVTLIRDCTCLCSDTPHFHQDPNLKYMGRKTVAEWMELNDEYRALPAQTRKTLQDTYQLYLRMTKLFDDEGVRIIAGSDAGGIWDIPGPSLHQEFDELATAGLQPLRILQSATLNGAEFLGRLDTMGTVEEGKLADLVLLDVDPTKSVEALHQLAGVYRGRWWSAEDLAGLKAKVERERVQPLI